MTVWQRIQLGRVATVGSGAGFPREYQGKTDEELPFLKVSDMNLKGNERSIECWNNTVSELTRAKLKATAFPAGAVIFPKIGAAVATNKKRLLTRPCCVDNNVMAVVPNRNFLEPEFLYFLLFTKDLSDFASAANPPSIRKSVVKEWPIPFPALAEQRRIVDILSRAEGIVRLRREAQKKATEIIPALFLDMFGDPTTNPKGWRTQPLRQLATFKSGGTPSKAREDFWQGDLPWVTPKDMKRPELDGAIDHVSDRALSETNIKLVPVSSVLIVVRGMILVHTVPVARSVVPLTINQDMKALVPTDSIDGRYLLWSLKASQPQLLKMVSTLHTGQES